MKIITIMMITMIMMMKTMIIVLSSFIPRGTNDRGNYINEKKTVIVVSLVVREQL